MEFLGKLPLYIALCRPINLILAGLTQWGVHQYILKPFLPVEILEGPLLLLFILCTACLMAGGFVINDILDLESDVINRPLKPLSSLRISKSSAVVFYELLLLSGAVLAVYIAWKIGELPLAMMYFGWAFLLFAYSKWWKGTVLVGNGIVSLFVASVPAMMLFAERAAFFAIQHVYLKKMIYELILMMVVLSFLINFVREIAKDVEDESGDSIAGYQTLVIKYGKKAAKIMMLCLIFITMLVCGIWIFFTSISLTLQQVAMMGLFIIAPLGVAIQILTSSTHKRNMSDLSALLRWILLAGVITCLTFSQSLPGGG